MDALSKTRWEYSQFSVWKNDGAEVTLEMLNVHGDEGWEAYDVTADEDTRTYHLKRPKRRKATPKRSKT